MIDWGWEPSEHSRSVLPPGTWSWPVGWTRDAAVLHDVEHLLHRLEHASSSRPLLARHKGDSEHAGHVCGGPLHGMPCTFIGDVDMHTVELRLRADFAADLGDRLPRLHGKVLMVENPDQFTLSLAERPPRRAADFIELALIGVQRTDLGDMHHEFAFGRGSGYPSSWGWRLHPTRCWMQGPGPMAGSIIEWEPRGGLA